MGGEGGGGKKEEEEEEGEKRRKMKKSRWRRRSGKTAVACMGTFNSNHSYYTSRNNEVL